MATLVAGGVWANSQGKHHPDGVPDRRPAAAAEPFRQNADTGRATVTSIEAKADVATSVPKSPNSVTTAPKQTAETAPTPISAELRAKLSNEFPLLAKIENLSEGNRFPSVHGDVVMVSIDGATPTVSVKELKALVDYFDQDTAHPVVDTYTVTLEDKTELQIAYTSDYSKFSTRAFVFANENYDLRKIDPLSFEGGDGYTRYRANSTSDTGVTILRPSAAGKARGDGKATDWLYAAQEVCQSTKRVKLDKTFVDQVRRERPDLARLNFANKSEPSVERQLDNLAIALQDVKCASDAWPWSAIKAGHDYTYYLEHVASMVHPLFKYDELPYMSVTAAQFAGMRAAYNSIH